MIDWLIKRLLLIFHVFIAFIFLLLETLSLYRFSYYYATDFLFILLMYNIFLPNERFGFSNYSTL